MLASGTQLGPYKICAPLGAGGMGEVYRAQDSRLDREVAIKVILAPVAHDTARLARFEREVKVVAALSHPNILAIHDYGTEQGRTFAVMELLEGETLRSRLDRAAMPWRKAIEIALAIADGLAAAHAKGIIHRDLKPENIFLTGDGRVKILDFGLARMEPPPLASGNTPTNTFHPAQTEAGVILGTVGYMSPEQVRGREIDARSDIFSLGCVLYEMVTGERPFARQSAVETMTAILHDEPPDLTDSGKRIPREVERVVAHCLEKNPDMRFQSARDLTFALRSLQSESTLSQRPLAGNLRRTIWSVAPVALLALTLGTGYLLWTRDQAPSESSLPVDVAKPIDSLAVLPLVNASGDSEIDFLGEGITEGLINTLSQLPDLRVMARSTVFRYKGKAVDPQSVGRDLRVRAVLTGRVTRRADTVSVQLDMVDASDGAQLWGEQFRLTGGDVQALQEEAPRQIAAKLRLKLTGEQERRLAKRYTENNEAYQLYLRGRFYDSNFTEEGAKKGIEYYERAIAIDPTYALAYSGLADAWGCLGNLNVMAPGEAYPRARAAALKALELDDELAEAHTSLAVIRMNHDWDWVSSERGYQRALALNPGYAQAHSLYAWHLGARGRLDEAIQRIKRTLELDPLSLGANANYGWYLYMARRNHAAAEQLRKTVEMDPNYSYARNLLGRVYEQQERYAEAIAEHQKALAYSGGGSTELAGLGYAYAIGGQTEEARKVLEQLKQRAKEKYVSPYSLAMVHMGLGETDQAFTWLERAYEQRDGWLAGWIKVDPRFDPLRSDPRFDDLLRRLGLSDNGPKDKVVNREQGIQSVAVLPFENVGGDPKTEFLSDGLADQTINSLSQVRSRDLKVRPFSSVSRYRGQKVNAAVVGRELNVQAVVTGTLHQQGDDLWISVALVDAREDNHLWGKRYQGKLTGILDLQDQIARDVAANLRLRLTVEEERQLTKRYTEDPEAYLLYREGMYHWNKFTEEGLATAIEYCERAIKRDPNYALGYAALARCHILLGTIHRGPRQTHPEARKYVAKALAIDDSLPEAHTALGVIYLFHDWNWPAAEREFKQAIAADPNGGMTRNVYASYLGAMGRLTEALASAQQAREVDPLAAPRSRELAVCYNWLRQYDQAIIEAKKALELDPNFFLAYREIGVAYAQKGMYTEAIQELQKGVELGKGHPRLKGPLGYAYVASGQTTQAKALLDELKDPGRFRFGCAHAIAQIHAALGDKDQAFEWLQKACDERDPNVIWLKVDFTLDNLRSDPRFDAILQDMGLTSN